ncbi:MULTISPECIES: helix-turn-helix domain-containing protein [Gracilibacillus]|uniref:helix-turn-helix domain-containing protein n=1 Tax=Gracilibacillus TaxID=74385 RepID=UPI000826E780|nr:MULTISPECIES: helix-turn-helix domain-containing protein [Gracilibacillus]
MDHHLKYSCYLVSETNNIPIYVLDKHGHIELDFSLNVPLNPLFSSRQEHINSLTIQKPSELLPKLYTNEFLEQFVQIPIIVNERYTGSVILGPSISPKPSENFLKDIISLYKLWDIETEVREYFYNVPAFSSWKLLQISILTCYLIFEKKFEIEELAKQNLLQPAVFQRYQQPDKEVSVLLQNEAFHQDPISEKRLYQFIKEGDKDGLVLYNLTFHHRSDIQFGKLARQGELRNQKNLKIATITLATRAAIAGGLHPEVAYTLGDNFIQELEEIRTIKEVEMFIENALSEFAERVKKSQKQRYSKPIGDCINYIFTHIYDELTLSVLAKVVSLKPKYVSNLFKQEVGVPITEYIQKTKIEEAKKLMTFTDYSLAEIYTLLNFTDQSYFTKVFKKHTGHTPKQYMKQWIDMDSNLL